MRAGHVHRRAVLEGTTLAHNLVAFRIDRVTASLRIRVGKAQVFEANATAFVAASHGEDREHRWERRVCLLH